MPLVPVEALIPYIYVLANNSFIDFIKKRESEREGRRKGEGEKRETKSFHCLFTPTFLRPSFLAPFYFFALRSRYGCLLGLNGQDRLNLCPSSGEDRIKGDALKSSHINSSVFCPPPFILRVASGTFHQGERVYK